MEVRSLRGISLGIALAFFGVILDLSPFGLDLEEAYSLPLLFRLRGPREPPAEIAVVVLDRASAEKLSQSEKPEQWSRDLHAKLVSQLSKAGAHAIAFDMFFKAPHSAAEDTALARAIEQAGNVACVEELDENLVSTAPVAAIANAAAAVIPFLLPNVERVDGYWTFKAGPKSKPSLPTLPVVAFQIYALQVYDDFRRLLSETSPVHAAALPPNQHDILASKGIEALMLSLRALLVSDPELGQRLLRALSERSDQDMPAKTKRILRTLLKLYGSHEWQYLNFYGPPGSIVSIPVADALGISEETEPGSPGFFSGKIVFVGFFEWSPVKQKDKDVFNTVFTRPDGLKLSGAEIGATAVANLLEDLPVRRAGLLLSLSIALPWGLFVSVSWRSWSTRAALATTLAVMLAYSYAAYHQFKLAGLWLPLIGPYVQSSIGIFFALWLRHREARKLIEHLRLELGNYLPSPTVDRLLRPGRPHQPGTALVYGTCLHTDIAGFAAISERIEPVRLSRVMDEYYQAIHLPVTRWGGIVSDQTGDSMLAVWAISEPDAGLRAQACRGALEIARVVEKFNEDTERPPLPTRIGLHSGQIALGGVAASEAGRRRAFGVIVNAASRIQELNKHLGTRILVSADVIDALEEFCSRPVGAFVLPGLGKPLTVYELLAPKRDAPLERGGPGWLCAIFAEGLDAYHGRDWHRASERFLEILESCPDDGPAQFYLKRSEHYRIHPPAGVWSPVVELPTK